MASAPNLKTLAIILRRTNYGEADRILTIITPRHGRQSVLARSVRKEKSKLAGGIELFAVCELGLVRGARNSDNRLWTLTSSRIVTFYDQIIGDYDRLQFGYEAIRQINRLAVAIDSPDLYETLNETLAVLNRPDIDLRLTKIWFYLRLARLNGNELNLLTDNNGEALATQTNYDYDAGERAFVRSASGRFTTPVLKLLRLLVSNSASVLLRLALPNDTVISEALYLAQIAANSG